MSERLNMLIDSAKGEIGKILVEEAAPALAGEMLKGTVLEAVTGMAGIAVPGVGNVMLSYKQKKLQKNFEIYVSKIVEHQNEINERLKALEEEKQKVIQANYFGLLADYASQSKQEEKIELIVNGFINIAGDVLSQEDTILMYYDTLDQMNMLDIRVLRLYIYPVYVDGGESEVGDSIFKICEEYGLDYSQLDVIKEKLTRLGLLESRNDIDMDTNMRNVMQYLEDVTKGKKNAKLKSLKHISKSESYRITQYGNNLFSFFSGIIEKKA